MLPFFVFSATLVAIVTASDPLAKESVHDTQRFCNNYAECRATARSQFERCVGGYTQMILAESEAIRSISTSNNVEKKCEDQLINAIETEIRPFYEHIEHDTFECARNIDLTAFNLGETEQLVCTSLLNELTNASHAIPGVTTEIECKTVYTEQLKRCDLIKECCPQFRHCRMKAELDNNVFGKEQRLAAELDLCLGKKEISQTFVAKIKDEISAKISAETRRAPTESSTTVSPPTPPASPALPTIPPPEKFFNNLVKILFPNLIPITTTVAPSGESVAVPLSKQIPAPHDKANFTLGLNKVTLNKLKQAAMKEAQRIELAKAATTTKAVSTTTTKVVSTTTTKAVSTTPITTVKEVPTETTNSVSTQTSLHTTTSTTDIRSDLKSEPEEPSTTSKSTFPAPFDANQALNSVYCQSLIECNSVISAQLAICDDRYAPENILYGITDFTLRATFLLNSNVTDIKVKQRCLESVDPESQRQLNMLARIAQFQNEVCIRESAAPFISNEVFQRCQSARILKVASEVFTSKEIPKEKSIESVEKCYSRVRELKQQCAIVESCCPQASRCESINNNLEKRKLIEIIEQLKEEQTLCEKRRMRILNGLV